MAIILTPTTGGFYLTDSLRAAAQWACYNKHDREAEAGILGESFLKIYCRTSLINFLEFVWDGTE